MEETKLIDESSSKLKAILYGIGEGISIIDKDLKIVWVNPIIEKWAGSLNDIKGRYCYKVYQKRDVPCDNCPTIKTLKTGDISKARQHAYDTGGTIKYFEFVSAPVADENGMTIAAVELAVDLTEKIELEHKLKEAKTRLQTVFDNISDGISVIDKDHQILRVNRGILKMFNKRDFPDLLNKKCYSEYHKDDSVCENCPAEKTFKEGKAYHVTRVCGGADKGRMVLDISTFPIKDDKEKVIQVIEYMKNITSIVKLEDQLLYQERLAGVGELAAGVAHEIRNPLGNITASAQFCLGKYKLHELAKKHLRIILKNAESANRIVKDLLDFAKPTEVSFELAYIDEVLGKVCTLIKTRCSKQRVRLTRRFSRRVPMIPLDEKRIEEAFLNFIINALDAMPEGGRMVIAAYPDFLNNEVVVSISDTGCGIPPENLDKIFSPFFTTKKDGTGLGLCLAQQVITHHEGKINISSIVEKGTDVVVRLPISRDGIDERKEIKVEIIPGGKQRWV